MLFEDMSLESIKQFQMLADNLALEFVRLVGGIEAIRLLFPQLNNSDMLQIQQRLQQVYSMNGMPFSSFFREYSILAQKEINKRERK